MTPLPVLGGIRRSCGLPFAIGKRQGGVVSYVAPNRRKIYFFIQVQSHSGEWLKPSCEPRSFGLYLVFL